MGTLLLLKYMFSEKTVLLLRHCGWRSSRYFILMQNKFKMLQFIPNALSTFLWAISDAQLWMINYFESVLFKGLIKAVGKPVKSVWMIHSVTCRTRRVISSVSHSQL